MSEISTKDLISKFKDNTKSGDTLRFDIKDKDGNVLRKEGEPAAYALAIEAKFNKDMFIFKK